MPERNFLEYFAGRTGCAVRNIPNTFLNDILEIRLRTDRPLAVTCENKVCYITENGQLTYDPKYALIVSEQDLCRTFEAVCQYSVHSFQREIAQGFITVKGGHRVGFCGTPVTRSGAIENIKHIGSMNFRIAREMVGCGGELYKKCFSEGLCGLLVAGAPGTGKTTLLRDLTRLLGARYRVSLIDERGELAACQGGIPQNNVGENTDVFDGYGKTAAVSAAVRVMSPQVIVCDEIGSPEDFSAIREASLCGVRTVAAIHAADISDLRGKSADMSCFDKIAFLSGLGKISGILETSGTALG